MELTYNLKPTGITFSLEENFPILKEGKKIGIFLSGGVESSLLSLISFNLYRKENVICFFSDNIFSANDPIRNSYIHTNIKKSEKLLDIKPIYLNFNYDIFLNNRKKFIEEEFQKIDFD
jgi:tRNA(Ile)-lysidine synthase TilS/MesJ